MLGLAERLSKVNRLSCSQHFSEFHNYLFMYSDRALGLDRFVTIILYHGGEVKHSPVAEFVGGNQSKFDFVDVEDMCISYLNGLGEKLGYMGPKRFYRLDSNRNKFRVISYQTDVLALCDGYSSKNREFTLYLEANIDELATQIGSSNPIAVVGDEKGKGVAIEGGVSPRFDEEDWAEVFKLVDSYGESAGWNCDQGVMQVDLQSEGEGSGHSEGLVRGTVYMNLNIGQKMRKMGKTGMRRGYKRVSRSHLNLITLQIQIFVSVKRILIVRTDPNRNVKGFRKDIIKDIRCHVSKHQAYRAKRKALNAIEGKAEDQFDQLWDYAAELRASNPRSTVIMAMTEGDDGTDRRKFEKLYGPGGILLTAVSIDPNNNLYPLAYAVVSGETRESWEWFLELLKGDLNVVRDDTYTFISDKQKGLIPAFESVFPGATNRFCVRHLHNNMKTAGFRGLAFKKTLWNAARATTLHEFNLRMEEMGHLDPKQHTCTCRKWDLTGIPCKHGMSAICSQSLEPQDFVNPCYSVETFLEVYKHAILPVNGPQLWTKTGLIPPLPPNFGRRSGRPSRARRVEHDEPVNKGKKRQRGQKKQPIRLKRQPYQVMCHYCGGTGHNQKGCERKKLIIQQPLKMLTQMTKQQPLNSQQEKGQHHLKTNRKRQHIHSLNQRKEKEWRYMPHTQPHLQMFHQEGLQGAHHFQLLQNPTKQQQQGEHNLYCIDLHNAQLYKMRHQVVFHT
ncbi:hypothetical protein Sango_0869600 [Sesamum angolense]|uniref:SWIM-type domain-containing protein n=1 Tax=Sesamum angolense TaxID=2727404 RepID=A0AAE1X4A8_9LAMI|nr:hypothetical protein Sango_0869600 [Sesamum angolense]